MNRKMTTVLMASFLVACICTYIVWHVLANSIAAARLANVTHVVAARGDIKLGEVLTDDKLTTIGVVGSLPEGAIVDRSKAVGRGVVSELYAGEPIMESRLAAVGSGGGLAATIPPGMRVCAVKVDDVVGVSGFVTPGMRVDVLISGLPPGPAPPTQGPKVKTLLQNIEVKSAGTDIQKDAEGKPHQVQVVNLLVAPDQAETLSLANSQTHIQLVLRNPLDTQTAKVQGNALGNLYADLNAPHVVSVAKKAVPALYTVVVLNGTKRSEASFATPEVR